MGKIEVKNYVLRVMSPIYVGYSDVYEPFNFVVDSRLNLLYFIDIDKFLLNLSDKDRQEIFEISKDTSIFSLIKFYNFMKSKLDYVKSHSDMILRKVKLCSGFVKHYNKVLTLNQNNLRNTNKEINQFQINMLSYNVNLNQPIIPGSSIKGAIRTAILNYYSNRVRKKINDNRKLECAILGYKEQNEDPLKYLKVSDFLPKKADTKIMYAVNVKKNGGRTSSPYQLTEVIETGAEFEGSISIIKPEKKEQLDLSFEIIEKALTTFYKKILDEEEGIYQKLGTKAPIYYGNVPLKIGRHSGGEAVTIEGHRRIKIRQGERFYISDKTTTMWFVSEVSRNYQMDTLEPFAWAELKEKDLINKEQDVQKTLSKTKKQNKKKPLKKNLDISALETKYKIRKK